MPRSRVTRGKLSAEVLSNGMLTSGLVASARNLSVRGNSEPKKVKKQEWQERAWYWYDTIEVFHYAVQWVGNTLSRAKLVVLENGEPTTNEKALEALANFFGGADNHGECLRQCGIHMTVAGEGYIIGSEVDGSDEWMVAAAVEVKSAPDGYKVEGDDVDPNESLIFRLWRPHPRKNKMSDSPTRPLLPILSQLHELTQYVSAQLDSRLAGAGLLLLPLEVAFPTQIKDGDSTDQSAALKAFITELAETMATAKANRGDASATVPLAIQGPAEHLDKIKHLTFWSELDEHATQLRDETIRRLALGMDMPPEALMGTGDVNHWGAWQIEDSLIKSHSEPLLALITEAITIGYLRTILEADGMSEEEAATFSIGADTSEMRLRPNRSKEALELGDRFLLSDEAMRRENGFEESDAPTDEEVARRILLNVAGGSPSPEYVLAAARKLGVDIEIPAEGGEPDGIGERPLRRSLEEHPVEEIPDTRDAAQSALLATSEAAVFRALERAGNKLKGTASKIDGLPQGVKSFELYQYVTLKKADLDHILDDAWSTLGVYTLPEGIDRAKLETHLDNYTRMLLTSRSPFNRKVLARYLQMVEGK